MMFLIVKAKPAPAQTDGAGCCARGGAGRRGGNGVRRRCKGPRTSLGGATARTARTANTARPPILRDRKYCVRGLVPGYECLVEGHLRARRRLATAKHRRPLTNAVGE